jgi:biotin synthase
MFSQRFLISPGAGIIVYTKTGNSTAEYDGIRKEAAALLDANGNGEEPSERVPTKEEIIHLLRSEDPAEIDLLFEKADKVRKKYTGDAVHIRGIIEASNICTRNCLYCGLRKDNSGIPRYRMDIPEIYTAAAGVRELGYGTVVIQTGESRVYDIDELCVLVSDIRSELGLAVTLSLGELKREEYALLREAGADRYLLRFETSDRLLFKRLKPDGDHEKRLERLRWLRELGFQVGSGIMIGLPDQSAESIADDILMFRELELDMVGAGPFIPNPDTPLASYPEGCLSDSLKLIALTRIVTLNTHIPVTTALGTIHPEGRREGLRCGANVIMPNCTPLKYKKDYLLYPAKAGIKETTGELARQIEKMVISCGRTIGRGKGHSLKIHSKGSFARDEK